MSTEAAKSVTPYFQSPGVTIYHGDCRDVLPHLSGQLAIISDPPYGMRAGFERRGKRKESPWDRTWKPITGDDAPFDPAHLLDYPIVALFGANHFLEKLRQGTKWLIWDKRCGTPADNNSDAELIWTNLQGATRIHRQLWRGIIREGEENVSRAIKLHPAQKPVSLMRWVIGECRVKSGITIVDSYMGSGSTLVAGQQLGFDVIGIEIEREHCDVAKLRLKQPSLLARVS